MDNIRFRTHGNLCITGNSYSGQEGVDNEELSDTIYDAFLDDSVNEKLNAFDFLANEFDNELDRLAGVKYLLSSTRFALMEGDDAVILRGNNIAVFAHFGYAGRDMATVYMREKLFYELKQRDPSSLITLITIEMDRMLFREENDDDFRTTLEVVSSMENKRIITHEESTKLNKILSEIGNTTMETVDG